MSTDPAMSDSVVELFNTASEAATQIEGATRSAVGLAGKARVFWNHPDFQTLTELLDAAKVEVKQIEQAASTVERSIEQARTVFSASFSVPPLPAPLARYGHATLANNAAAAAGHAGGLVPGLALGVGLLNLGIGIYNTVQLKQLGWQLGELQSDITTGFARLEASLAWQSHQLAILAAAQADIMDQLQRLRQDLQEGIERVIGTIASVDERRISDEYQTQVTLVANRHRALQETLLEGHRPSERDLGRLLDAGEALVAWVKPKLSRTQPGDPARLPYRVAQAMAARASADVRNIENGQIREDRAIKRLLDDIAEDAFALCDKRSLYWIGVEVPELITQYVYLFRGLQLGNMVSPIQNSDQDRAPNMVPIWEDGLAPLRALFGGPTIGTSAWLPIGSLRDLTWYTEWAGLDPDNTDVGGTAALDLLAVARGLGAPGRPDSRRSSDLQALLAMALPSFRNQAQARLLAQFGWQRVPRIGLPIIPQKMSAPTAKALDIVDDNEQNQKANDKQKARPAVPIGNKKCSLAELSDTAIVEYLTTTVKIPKESSSDVFFHPNIPPKKLNNARASMKIPAQETVLALIDTTVFGGAAEGVAICRNGYFFKEFTDVPRAGSWQNFPAIKVIKNELCLGSTRISVATAYFKIIEVCMLAMVKLATDGWLAPPGPPK